MVVALHGGAAPLQVRLPATRPGFAWHVLADSAAPSGSANASGRHAEHRRAHGGAAARAAGRAARPRRCGRRARPAGSGGRHRRRVVGSRGPAPRHRRGHAAGAAAGHAPARPTRRRRSPTASPRLSDDAASPLPPALVVRAGEAGALRLGPALREGALRLVLDGEHGRHTVLNIDAAHGVAEPVAAPDGRVLWTRRIALPPLPAGRYLLRADGVAAPCHLTVAPPRCHLPAGLRAGGRATGLAVQLYSLRRARGDQGIGDLTDSGDAGPGRGAAGIAGDRAEPAARPVPAGPQPGQPVPSVRPPLPRSAVHRRRRAAGAGAGGGGRTRCGGAGVRRPRRRRSGGLPGGVGGQGPRARGGIRGVPPGRGLRRLRRRGRRGAARLCPFPGDRGAPRRGLAALAGGAE